MYVAECLLTCSITDLGPRLLNYESARHVVPDLFPVALVREAQVDRCVASRQSACAPGRPWGHTSLQSTASQKLDRGLQEL